MRCLPKKINKTTRSKWCSILERKGMDDYSRSIIDGRYYEQKFRLKRSGVAQVIYLIEGSCTSRAHRLPPDTLESAMVSTQIHSGFQVVRTDNIKSTVRYVANFTTALETYYRQELSDVLRPPSSFSSSPSRHCSWQSYSSFCEKVTKNKHLSLSDTFAKQLMQIGGCSASKAAAIIEHYATPKLLMKAFETFRSNEGRKQKDRSTMLSNIVCNTGRRVGPALSARIYAYYFNV
eukprot:TRINITY_DN11013_c0_g2_i2.p1 TRINITY_DN11013_c0_g2~~TRINITY_DN11013_c0_g2_i2.p1  ORF type:complete len:234 (-),score=38.89 TRINITY_DN11013_c0_g2_i2:155-856(-)